MTNLMRVTVLGAVTTAAMLVVVHPAREGMSGVGVTATGAGMPHVGAIMDRGKVLTVADTPLWLRISLRAWLWQSLRL